MPGGDASPGIGWWLHSQFFDVATATAGVFVVFFFDAVGIPSPGIGSVRTKYARGICSPEHMMVVIFSVFRCSHRNNGRVRL